MRRLLALLALVLSATVLLTPPAAAGGPTSVLITHPSSGQATALYHSDARYAQLEALLAGGESLDDEPALLGTRALNLTWMAHDVSPWKSQQLHLDAEGGPVLATYHHIGSGRTTWIRIAEGKAVLALADTLFEPGSGSAPASAPAPEPVVVENTVTETAWWSLSGWRWSVLGLALGAGVTLLAVSTTRSRSQQREPRQVLVDVAP